MTHPLFAVTATEIQSLNDEQARELVARLCRAEATRVGAIKPNTTWGGDQRAKDGGIDVRFEADDLPNPTTHLPSRRIGYQVKAEIFPPSKIDPEMAPKGVLRRSIVDFAATGGSYIIVSTRDSVSDSALSDRLTAMKECLDEHGLSGKVHLDFFDSRRMADWAEQHPSIVVWVKNVLGAARAGWRPYGPWAYHEQDTQAPYVMDEKVKVFVPNADEGSDITVAINSLRADLRSGATVRLVGLSGVGKTRLVQALFDERVETGTKHLSPDAVVYADLSDDVDPQPTAMVEALKDNGHETYVVVDNCSQELHRRLSEIVAKPGSRLGLITVEYDIRDDLPEGTSCYRLEGSSDAVIKELLVRRYKHLTAHDVDRVTQFSDGNARVAFALASASERSNELAQLTDDDLFRRLFHQKHIENDELLSAAEAASLVYSFDGESTDDSSELVRIASVAGLSIASMYRHVAELQRRGLVQQRGKWRAVLPHAIANRLAARSLANYPASQLIEAMLDKASDRVAKSFSRRLGYLHSSARARAIVAEFLKPNGRLDELETLSNLGREILKNVAPVDPAATLSCLVRAVGRAEVLKLDAYDAQDFVQLARSLAYDAAQFDDSLAVLRAFAERHRVSDRNNSSHEAIYSLFTCHLSGTHASPEHRASTVLSLLKSPAALDRDLGLEALSHAFETDHFSSQFSFEFGSRKRDYGWAPQTYSDVKRWYGQFLDIATEIVRQKNDVSDAVKQVLGRAFRGLWRDAGMLDELEALSRELAADGGWPDGWVGVRETIYWSKKSSSQKTMPRLQALEILLAPRDLIGQIRAQVLSRGAATLDLLEDDDGDAASSNPMAGYKKAQAQAEQLGKIASSDTTAWAELLPELLTDRASEKTHRFGVGLGIGLDEPAKLLAEARRTLEEVGSGRVVLIPIRGLLQGWHSKDPAAADAFLDEAVTDEVWGPWLPELQCAVGLQGKGLARVMQSLVAGLAPNFQYRYLSMGRATEPLDIAAIAELLRAIASRPNGLDVAIDLLGMVVHSAHEQGDQFVRDSALLTGEFLSDVDFGTLDTNDTMHDHHLDQLLTFALSNNAPSHTDEAVLKNLLSWEASSSRVYAYRRGKYLTPFFKLRPEMTLNAVYQPDKNGSYNTARALAANRDSDRDQRPMSFLPVEITLQWCGQSDDRYSFIAETCLLYTPSTNETKQLSDIAGAIFNAAPDKSQILRIYVSRIPPMGGSGSMAAKLRGRIPILDGLNTDADERLKQTIASQRARLTELASRMERQEAEEERTRNATFE
ncbi:hypothetical protein DEVEQU_00533 [Devosia equisanguinis]|uniref:Uncharacterized protein n=1 Tax=Devosia equisanguinis TaxID=2490941 RepID=A0A447I795_9HYPH|nr:hypothetical protein [Devosia equisanguinis]VDS03410.1 hypothetical protein DEVEQU_00533 [Devosia equisanguinis]